MFFYSKSLIFYSLKNCSSSGHKSNFLLNFETINITIAINSSTNLIFEQVLSSNQEIFYFFKEIFSFFFAFRRLCLPSRAPGTEMKTRVIGLTRRSTGGPATCRAASATIVRVRVHAGSLDPLG